MCGIFGTTLKKDFSSSADAIKHRGPDDDGKFRDVNISLYQARLSIIDLSENGHQPMFNDSSNLSIIFNGEIYNFKDIKKDLVNLGYSFKSNSDTEVLLKGFEEYGSEIFSKLRGMWATVLYDVKKGELTLSRDQFGIKPLYYAISGKEIVFASEVKALLPQLNKLTPNTSAYFLYYNFGYFPGDLTSFKEIKKVLPGEIINFNLRSGEIKRSFAKIKNENNRTLITDENEESQLINKSLLESVEKHYISDVPVGLLLSGGNDSSFLAALSKEAGQNPTCFSVSIEGSGDKGYAKKVARHLNLPFVEEKISIENFRNQYDLLWDIIDQPTGDVSFIPTSLIFSTIKNRSKVVLSGEGGDELFGGYQRHKNFAGFDQMKFESFFPESLFSLKSENYMKFANPVLSRARNFLSSFETLGNEYLYTARVADLPIKQKETLLYMQNYYENHPYKNLIQPNLFFDLFMYLPYNLMYKGDMSSMAYGIESRVPFLDKEFFNTCNSVSPDIRFSTSALSKKIMKESMKKYLPKELIYRKKSGFGIDIRKYAKEKVLSDLDEAITYHQKYSEELGLKDSNICDLVKKDKAQLLLDKYPRFVFSLITNYKVVSKYWKS